MAVTVGGSMVVEGGGAMSEEQMRKRKNFPVNLKTPFFLNIERSFIFYMENCLRPYEKTPGARSSGILSPSKICYQVLPQQLDIYYLQFQN